MSWLDRVRPPLLLIGALAIVAALAIAFIQSEFGSTSRIVLAVGILCIGGSVAIDPQKAFQGITRRESIYGSNATVLTIAFIGILVLVNVLATRFHQRWDLTAQSDFTLSEATVGILRDLPQPVNAVAFFSSELRDRQQAEDLLKEYETRANGKFSWKMVDTNADPTAAEIAGVNVDGTIKFTMGERKQDTITPDEAHITTSLIKLVNPNPLKVYFVVGHGERSLEGFNEDGYSDFKTQVQADNYVMDTLNLLATQRVPEDAKAIIIASPKSAFQPEELEAIKQYLDGKGRMVLLVDALQDESNAEEIIKRWDLTLGKGVAIDPVSSLPQSAASILVAPGRYALNHQIVPERLRNTITVFPFATSVEIPELIKRGVDVSGLAFTYNDRSFLERNPDVVTSGNVGFDEGVDKKGPLTLAVAVEELENPDTVQETMPGMRDPNARVKNRAVIIGSSGIANNFFIKSAFGNRDFALNALNWVTEYDQLITTRPRIEERRTVFLSNPESNFVLLSSAVGLPALLLAAGVFIWWRRR